MLRRTPARRLLTFLLPLAVVAGFALSGVSDEYLSGIIWPEPKRVTPGEAGGPPSDAVVLFDGTNLDQWEGGDQWKIADGCAIPQHGGIHTKESFGDCQLHVEFATPERIEGSGQGRGNSGVYLMGHYEVQVLDSFGLEGENNECGGLYSVNAPLVNMCFPPLAWQTYDIEHQAARFDGDKKTQNARITIKHNGVTIYDHYEMPRNTPGGAEKEAPGRGPLMLQDHGNPMRFRNIWVRPLN